MHVLSLQTFPARRMNSSLTPYPCKHLLILPTTYPCHVLLDPPLSTHTRPHICYSIASTTTYISFIRIHTVHLSVMFSHPTHSVCPPSQCMVIDELSSSLSAARTALRGKDPLARSLPDSQKQLPWPTKTQHKAFKWQPVRLLLL